MTWTEYLLEAAKKSKWDSGLWLRYLNKVIQRDQILLSQSDIDYLTHSDELTSFQRVFLELATQKDTRAWEVTVALSEPATSFVRLQAVLKELSQE